MLVAITGGTGFIGSLLVRCHIENGDNVRVLSRKAEHPWADSSTVDVIQGDLVSGAGVNSLVNGVDVLYHCAGEIHDPEKMHALHVQGTENLLQASSGKVKHWVQLSSVGVYGPVREGVITEKSLMNPAGMYEKTKAESDLLVIQKAEHLGMTYTILRPSNVFGVNMPNQSLFNLIKMIEKGVFFYIGSSGASANYVHVDNVVMALQMCAVDDRSRGKVFNLSDHMKMELFINLIADSLGKERPKARLSEGFVRLVSQVLGFIPSFPLSSTRIDAMTLRAQYSTEHIEHTLGYKHCKSLEEGLIELVQYWKCQK